MEKTILGLIAASLTTFSFLPQVIEAIKTKNLSGICLKMYVILVIGVFLWVVYGLMISDLPVIIANIITLCFTLIILGLKIKYK